MQILAHESLTVLPGRRYKTNGIAAAVAVDEGVGSSGEDGAPTHTSDMKAACWHFHKIQLYGCLHSFGNNTCFECDFAIKINNMVQLPRLKLRNGLEITSN